MAKKINVALADDHDLFRAGLIALLKEYSNINILFGASNGEDLLDKLEDHKPDIILLDIEMPVLSGSKAIDIIKRKYPEIKVIMLSMYFNDAFVLKFIQKGAAGFLPKNCSADKIADALTSVYEKGYFYDEKISGMMASKLRSLTDPISPMLDPVFTRQELAIISYVAQMFTNQQIAREMGLSIRTVEGHRYNIGKKSNTKNTLDLVEFARRNGLLE